MRQTEAFHLEAEFTSLTGRMLALSGTLGVILQDQALLHSRHEDDVRYSSGHPEGKR